MRQILQIAAIAIGSLLLAISPPDAQAQPAPTVASAKQGPRVGFFKRLFGEMTWEEVRSVVSSPKEASSYVRNHVEYKEDFVEEWASGETTWQRGTGDCEDLAACVADLCKANGFSAEIVVFYPVASYEAHAVAIGKHDGKLWISSNGWYQTVKSFEDAKQLVAKEMGWRGKEIKVAALKDVSTPLATASK